MKSAKNLYQKTMCWVFIFQEFSFIVNLIIIIFLFVMGFGDFFVLVFDGGGGLRIGVFLIGRSFTTNWGFQTAIAIYNHT